MTIPDSQRDIFLSHRSTNKDFVRLLAADVEAISFQGRNLLTWLDEAEIRAGQSITGMVNQGLEVSRFIALIMTPEYFKSESGWTEAEWHSALYTDPDNRKARIIPIFAADCPYVPFLLRHLKAIDLRGKNYERGLKELIAILRDEPLPRPIANRGQLITVGGKIERSSLIAERAVIQGDPDTISEKLYCNLLPIERLPQYVYVAPIAEELIDKRADGSPIFPSKTQLKEAIRTAQLEAGIENPYMPAFRIFEGQIVTFHDLQSPESPFAAVIDDTAIDPILTSDLLSDAEDRKLVISLLNMCLDRHAHRIGLVIDEIKSRRFYFPPSKDGNANVITWMPNRKKVKRTVAKPCIDKQGQTKTKSSTDQQEKILFWRHLGAYLKIIFLANKLYLQIVPTWVLTEDGVKIKTGPKVGPIVIKWTGVERNLQVLYHVRFWATVLRAKSVGQIIQVWAGEQSIEISVAPAFVQQAFGIEHDRKNLMDELDQAAWLLAEEEEELATEDIEAIINASEDIVQEENFFQIDDSEEEYFLEDE